MRADLKPEGAFGIVNSQSSTRALELPAREGVLPLAEPFALHFGGTLPEPRLAWRIAGEARLPLVLAIGGISGHRRVFDEQQPAAGWWHEVVGPGRALDTTRLRVLGIDYLGGSGASSGPPPGSAFGQEQRLEDVASAGAGAPVDAPPPSIASVDQAAAIVQLLDHLGIAKLPAVVGASYGAMVALALGERWPARVGRLVVISGADRAHPMATAWRTVQRRTVRFAQQQGAPADGLELARALAMATYRSPEEFVARFAAQPRRVHGRFVFPVEEYLFARGRAYAAQYRPDSFLCLSESIDLHRVDAARITVPTTVVGVREDQLVPIEDMRALAARLPDARLHEISSPHGHDAFLKEPGQLRPAFDCLYGEC
jgi:homoserine O-acetyltransferase